MRIPLFTSRDVYCESKHPPTCPFRHHWHWLIKTIQQLFLSDTHTHTHTHTSLSPQTHTHIHTHTHTNIYIYIYRSFYNCGTFWGRLKMTISCKFNKLFFEKYSDWHSYSQGKIAGTGCWSLFLDKKICFCITFGKILSTLLLTNHEMLQVLQKEFKEYEQHNIYVWMSP